MIKNSSIQWTGVTWNPWQGCTKKSPGCKFCYMYRDKKRFGQDPYIVVRSKPDTFEKPLKIQAEIEAGKRKKLEDRLVFTCSWSDFFNVEADEWRNEAWDIIKRCPDVIFQILTKLPDRTFKKDGVSLFPDYWDSIRDHVWLGVSVENNDYRWRLMSDFVKEFPARVRFVSLEPLLEEIHLSKYLLDGIDWVILGGESGPGSRKCDVSWMLNMIKTVRNQSNAAIFVKQLGSNAWYGNKKIVTKHYAGGEMEEWPDNLDDLRIREFPAGFSEK